jgi:DNA-directed RNA polymerase subunit N (RpoN/RPB10)
MSMIGHNQQQRSVQGLTDEDRKILRKAVMEMNDSMTRVGAERELQKETTNEIADKLGIDKKLFRRMSRAYFRANFKEEVQENTDFEEFYTTVMEKTAS